MTNPALTQLFESDILSDETKTAISEGFQAAIDDEKAKLEVSFAAKFASEVERLNETTAQMIEDAVEDATAELCEEVATARTLEVEYAGKLEQFKEDYVKVAEATILQMVSEQVAEEIEQLREEVEEAQKNQFGVRIYEAFSDVFASNFGGVSIDQAKHIRSLEEQVDAFTRKEKMEELLEGYSGRKRAVAMSILADVPTSKLTEKFNQIETALTEGQFGDGEVEAGRKKVVTEGDEASGDEGRKGRVIIEGEEYVAPQKDEETEFDRRMRKMLVNAGIKR